MQHTSRPSWTVEIHLPTFHGDKATYSVVDADGVIVAICGTEEANAHLIAAAPALLSTLEKIADAVDTSARPTGREFPKFWARDLARAVILAAKKGD